MKIKTDRIYKNLELAISLSDYTHQEICKKMNLSINAMLEKRRGVRAFSFDECVRMKKLLKYKGNIETLFDKSENI